jgi:hypothetical protein
MIACMNTLVARATLCHPERSEGSGSFATLRMTLCGHARACTGVDRAPLFSHLFNAADATLRAVPQDEGVRFIVRLGAVSGRFSFAEREANQRLGRGAGEYRLKTDKRWVPRAGREPREEEASVQQGQRSARFLASDDFF